MSSIARTATAAAPYAYHVRAVSTRRIISESTAYAAAAEELVDAYRAMGGWARIDVAPAVPVNGYPEGLPVRRADVAYYDASEPQAAAPDRHPDLPNTPLVPGSRAARGNCRATVALSELNPGDLVSIDDADPIEFLDVEHHETTGEARITYRDPNGHPAHRHTRYVADVSAVAFTRPV